MIGQRKNKQLLMRWKKSGYLPHFIIIQGRQGSGRLTFAKYILKQFDVRGLGYLIENGIDDVRNVITLANNVNQKSCFIFRDCEKMSLNAKNSLLKITEEPNENIYIIMTVNDEMQLLDTLKSRATIIRMQPYSKKELNLLNKAGLDLKYINTPGQLKNLDNAKLEAYTSFCEKLVKSIAKNDAKSMFNLLNELNKDKRYSKDEEKTDFSLLVEIFIDKMNENKLMNTKIIETLNFYSTMIKNWKTINQINAFRNLIIALYGIVKNGTE